jgi:hypothetical protein
MTIPNPFEPSVRPRTDATLRRRVYLRLGVIAGVYLFVTLTVAIGLS